LTCGAITFGFSHVLTPFSGSQQSAAPNADVHGQYPSIGSTIINLEGESDDSISAAEAMIFVMWNSVQAGLISE
jgi:hypothetical protein